MKKDLNLSRGLVSSQDVIGVKVKNPQNEDLGKIEMLIIEKITGKTCYVILSFGGFLGLGDKLFPLPWNEIHYNPESDAFILNVPKETLKQAPQLDKNKMLDFNFDDRVWGESVFKHYKTKPYWQ